MRACSYRFHIENFKMLLNGIKSLQNSFRNIAKFLQAVNSE